MEESRQPRDKPMHIWSIATKEPRMYKDERIASSTKYVGETGQPHAKD